MYTPWSMRTIVGLGIIFSILVVVVVMWLSLKPVAAPSREEIISQVPPNNSPYTPHIPLPPKVTPSVPSSIKPVPTDANTTLPLVPVTSGTKSVALGESFAVPGGYTLTPIKIIEDSRCKPNVQCIWAGRLVVYLRVESQRKVKDSEITIGQGMVLNGYDITLMDYISNKFIFKIEVVQK